MVSKSQKLPKPLHRDDLLSPPTPPRVVYEIVSPSNSHDPITVYHSTSWANNRRIMEDFLGALGRDTPRAAAAKIAGLSLQQVTMYENTNMSFALALRALESRTTQLARGVVIDSFAPTTPTADFKPDLDTAKWYLTKKAREEFGDRTETTTISKNLNVNVTIPPDEQERLLRMLL
jgi:hypothetical protein